MADQRARQKPQVRQNSIKVSLRPGRQRSKGIEPNHPLPLLQLLGTGASSGTSGVGAYRGTVELSGRSHPSHFTSAHMPLPLKAPPGELAGGAYRQHRRLPSHFQTEGHTRALCRPVHAAGEATQGWWGLQQVGGRGKCGVAGGGRGRALGEPRWAQGQNAMRQSRGGEKAI